MFNIKKILNTILQEFVYGAHLISLGFAGIVFMTTDILDVKINWQILLIAYLISQITYNYNHLKEVEKDFKTNPERTDYLKKTSKKFIIIYIIFFLLALIYRFNINFFIFTIILLSVSVLYTTFFKEITKKIIGFKDFYVSICWAMGVFLPLFYYYCSFKLFFLLLFIFVLLRLLLDTIFFDIKDLESDKKENLLTFPVKFGKEKTIFILHVLNLFSFIPLFLGIFMKIIPIYAISLIIIYFYSFYYIYNSKKMDPKRIRFVSYILVDGQYIFWPIIVIFGKVLLKQF